MVEKVIHAVAEVHWYKLEKSGKVMPPQNTTSFAANARFKNAKETDIISVVLYYGLNELLEENRLQIVGLYFLSPEIVLPYIENGSELFITQGPKVLAEAKIISIKSIQR